MTEARERTERLLAPIRRTDLARSHHPVMGPVSWDAAHIAQQEDLWIVQTLGGRPETEPGANERYDAYKNPRSTRAALPLLDLPGLLRYRRKVRERALEVLDAGPRDEGDPLWQDLYVPRMIVLHEHQHNETILQHLAAYPRGAYAPPGRVPAPQQAGSVALEGFVRLPGATMQMGVPARTAGTYDNEWLPHEVEVAPFAMQQGPVTNGAYLRFIEAGGYQEPAYWSDGGWKRLVEEEGVRAPMYWEQAKDGAWWVRSFDRLVPLPLDHPVCHVAWYEADAYARWAGARLPTEAEWEYAATIDPVTAEKRRYPWGDASPSRAHANLDQSRYGTDPVGSHPEGMSPHGIHQLIGDTWEWTASTFSAYPGFEAFPYRDYSERFFDQGLMVMRGGAWATRPLLRLGTFRNWDLPERRQVFAGFRLVKDADGQGI